MMMKCKMSVVVNNNDDDVISQLCFNLLIDAVHRESIDR